MTLTPTQASALLWVADAFEGPHPPSQTLRALVTRGLLTDASTPEGRTWRLTRAGIVALRGVAA